MKEILCSQITNTVKNLCIEANKILPDDLVCRIKDGYESEEKDLPKNVMSDLLYNLDCAKELNIPICQDTGMAVIFAEIGQDVHITGGDFEDAVNEGVRQGYVDGLLRKSIVGDPLLRVNTNDNTPAVIHTRIVAGENIKITVAPKGFGSENMSRIKMFTPSATKEDIMDFVVETVTVAGGNPCPPIVLGVGIGGDFEYCAYLSKKALCRDTSQRNENPFYMEMENDLLRIINETNIGPQGFGGKTTALAVNIETAPTHIAGLPVAVNVGCHVTRHKTAIL
ncbi:MAG: fumarate hydratase [Clostridia bacterium]|nr:fumarate hydratase [Clostridia bacterium]MBR5545016.1 fumarate hydratase [Clostridia bacterium]